MTQGIYTRTPQIREALSKARLRLLGPPQKRFWNKVKKTDGCWFWKGPFRKNGYGHFVISQPARKPRKTIAAHCFAYQELVGPIPEGCDLHHRCETRGCVNPDHLVPLLRKEHQLSSPKLLAYWNRNHA